VGVAADALGPERRGASSPKEADAEMLVARRWVKQRVVLIRDRRRYFEGWQLVRVFAGTKLRRGP